MAPLSLAAAPAAAQVFNEGVDEEIARSLPDPRAIDDAAVTVDRVVGAVLDVPVGDLANAVDPYGRRKDPDTTVGDLGSRDDPYFEDRVRSEIYDVTDELGAVVAQVGVVAPVLRRSLGDLERNLEVAIRGARPRY